MNKDILKGKWSQVKGTIQKKWGQITDDDLTKIKGDTTRLKGILQEKYGYTKHEAEKMYNEVFDMGSNLKDGIVDKGTTFRDKVNIKKQELLENEGNFRDRIPGNEYLTDEQIIAKRNEEIATYRQKERFEDRYFDRHNTNVNDTGLECEDIQAIAKNRVDNEVLIGEEMKRNDYLEDRELTEEERIHREAEQRADKYHENDYEGNILDDSTLREKAREVADPHNEEDYEGARHTGDEDGRVLIDRHFDEDARDDYVYISDENKTVNTTRENPEYNENYKGVKSEDVDFATEVVNNEGEHYVHPDALSRADRYFEDDDVDHYVEEREHTVLDRTYENERLDDELVDETNIRDRRNNETIVDDDQDFRVTHRETVVDHEVDDDYDPELDEEVLYGEAEYERDLLSGKDVAYETEFDGINRHEDDVRDNLDAVDTVDEEYILIEEDETLIEDDDVVYEEDVILEEDLYLDREPNRENNLNVDNNFEKDVLVNPDEYPVTDEQELDAELVAEKNDVNNVYTDDTIDHLHNDDLVNPDEYPVSNEERFGAERFAERAEIENDLYGSVNSDLHTDRRDVEEGVYDRSLYTEKNLVDHEVRDSERINEEVYDDEFSDVIVKESDVPGQNLHDREVEDEFAKRDVKSPDLDTRAELEERLLQDEKDGKVDEDFYREEAEATEYIDIDNQLK